MRNDREYLAATFNDAADLYDDVRPGYPDAVIDGIIALSGIAPGGSILEIGAGTGKATLPFARRGYRILALEPGARLAAVARRNLAAYPNVRIQEQRFEDWSPDAVRPNLIVAATSFPWVDPAVRYTKSAENLGSGGCCAVVWHAHVLLPGQDQFFEDVQEAYNRYARHIARRPGSTEKLPNEVDPDFLATGAFEPVAVRHYPWTEVYDRNRYIRLLATFSDHIALPEDARTRLFDAIGALIDSRYSGRVVKHQVTVLQVVRRV